MGLEIDLLKNYPKTKRHVEERGNDKTPEDRAIARQFGQDFFDGSRSHGYAGFSYFPRFCQAVIPDFIEQFQLNEQSSLLDIGCAKGFMLYDLSLALPSMNLAGIDVSTYAIDRAKEETKKWLKVGNA